jgi:O-antigen/teichoic acid export membrane protein
MASPGLLRNMAYNVVGTLLPMLVSLVTVPVYIATIGADRYGIVAIAWLLLGYFGFLDFGLSRATANALSRLANDTSGRRGKVIATAFWLNVTLGLIAGVVFYWTLVPLTRHVFALPAGLASEIRAAVPWIACMLPLGMIGGVASGTLQSRERFLLMNVVQSSGYIAGQIVPLALALWFGPSLQILLAAALLVRFSTIVTMFAVVIRLERPLNPFGASRTEVRNLFGYGAWVSVSSILTPALETFDQFLIGALLGPAAVTHYVVPMNLAIRSQVLATALASALFPRLSRESGQIAADLNRRASVALAYGFSALCGPAIILAAPFLRLWLGVDFAAQAGLVARILLVGAWLNGLAFLPYGLLQAQGRPHVTAKVHLLEVLPFIAGVYGLVKLFGLPGAAFGWTLRNLCDSVVLFYLAGSRWAHFLAIFPAVALMVVCFIAGSLTSASGWVAVALAAVIGPIFLIAGALLEPELSRFSKRILHANAVTCAVAAGRMRSKLSKL